MSHLISVREQKMMIYTLTSHKGANRIYFWGRLLLSISIWNSEANTCFTLKPQMICRGLKALVSDHKGKVGAAKWRFLRRMAGLRDRVKSSDIWGELGVELMLLGIGGSQEASTYDGVPGNWAKVPEETQDWPSWSRSALGSQLSLQLPQLR